MPSIFPPEIINYSAETYYSRLSNTHKTIYWVVLAFFALAIMLLPVIKIDISTQSRGVVRSPIENTVIQSAVYGEVTRFNLKENAGISMGDTLLVLNTERIEEQIALEKQKRIENERFINDIQLLLSGQKPVGLKYMSEYNRYQSKVKEQNIQIDYLQNEYNIEKTLFEKGVNAKSDYLYQKNNLDKAIGVLAYLQEEYKTSWQSEQTRLELENQTIDSNIKQLEKEKRQYVITCPVSGTLIQVAGFQQGNFISPSQPLAYISVADSLLAECYVSPMDIGYIHPGQEVSFQMDAFDYREWGLISGMVDEVINDVISIENQPMFRVRCILNESSLKLKNGYEGNVKKGMTLTGRFKLNKRSLFQLLFDKVDDWMNPKIVKNN